MEHHDIPVLAVGAGAAGLAAAITLSRYGIETLLVEQRREPSNLPRATVISTRSMELIRSWGLERDVLAGGVDADVWIWECETLSRAAEGKAHAVGYPTRQQAAMVSPCTPATVPQDWLEGVLRDHVVSLPAAQVEFGTQVVAVDLADRGVLATLRDETGKLRTVHARYLVAADGAHSTVRRLLGVEMRRAGAAYSGAQVVFRAPLCRLLGGVRYGLYVVTTPTAPGLFLPAGRDDRWVYGPGPAPGEASLDVHPARIAERIRLGAGVDDLELSIEHIGEFHSPGERADRFRAGDVFLVGDAAHRVTPRGGTGMNTALQSGHDLAWKLAWVLQGWAEPDLLDSYEAERRVVAEHNLARSVDPDGSRRPVLDELNVDLGGRLAHAWLPWSTAQVSTLDLLGPGWTLFTGPCRDEWEEAAMTWRAPVIVCALDAVTARTLGVQGDGALLVRPDGVPAGVWTSPDAYAISSRDVPLDLVGAASPCRP